MLRGVSCEAICDPEKIECYVIVVYELCREHGPHKSHRKIEHVFHTWIF